jgi:hypothetical protein
LFWYREAIYQSKNGLAITLGHMSWCLNTKQYRCFRAGPVDRDPVHHWQMDFSLSIRSIRTPIVIVINPKSLDTDAERPGGNSVTRLMNSYRMSCHNVSTSRKRPEYMAPAFACFSRISRK